MSGFRLPAAWPPPADPAAAASLAEDLVRDRAGKPSGPWTPPPEVAAPVAALVACLGGNSPYLSGLARREHDFLTQVLHHGPTRMAATALRRLRTLGPETARPEIAAGLRRAKRQVALAAAIADIGGLWSLEQVTGALSLLAEAALRVAVAHLLLGAHRAGLLRLPDPRRPERGSGFVVLGMGKLGARELNYSSDIDLVLLYDPAAQDDRDGLPRTFARLAADLVSLMQVLDGDGYVFRTDLRLRPDPGATPPAISLLSAITYYEGHGLTWERAAMTKARPVAGDIGCGERFLEAIRPFVWRRHLDFAAFEDIHAMKRRIDRHAPAPARSFGSGGGGGGGDADDPVAALLGHDVKLGHGGIREIEFVAQTLQLVWGGREPALRDPTTLGALSGLAAAGHLRRSTADALAHSYRRLRGVEHRLQMQADRQTHSLPATRAGFEAFALFIGDPDGTAFARGLLPDLRRTRDRFERMFHSRPRPGDVADGAERAFEPDAPDLAEQLGAVGFPAGPQALELLRGWGTDRHRALRQPRARTLLHGLAPALLRALAGQRDPLAALIRFDTLLSRQGAGVQLLSLFERNPLLLERIARVLGAAPSLADHLAAVPGALDGLLGPEDDVRASRTLLRIVDGQMRQAAGVGEAIRVARTLVRGEEFRLSVAQMEARLDVDRAGIARTALAERVIAGMLGHVQADHQDRYGVVRGGGLCVVALGKAGSREMMSGSDLDLMLIYDHPEDVAESGPAARPRTGQGRPRPLAASQYYARLAHGLIAALAAPGIEGPLYALDMRLRPSGNKGPVAVSLPAFQRYHAERAWTWERMALSRARVVAGPPALRRRVGLAIATALAGPGAGGGPDGSDPGIVLRRDAAAMRARLMRDLPPRGPWDVKLRAGGLLEVEFIAQILQLASPDPALRHPATRIALARLGRAGMLPRGEAAMLIEADRFWRALQGMLRILLGVQVPQDLRRSLPEPVVDALLRGLDMESAGLDGLEARCERTAAAVRSAFRTLVGPLPTADLPLPQRLV